MTTTECDFGCECGELEDAKGFGPILDEKDFNRLVEEKFNRARRYSELMSRIGGQFESD